VGETSANNKIITRRANPSARLWIYVHTTAWFFQS